MNKVKEVGSGVTTDLMIGEGDYIKSIKSKQIIANIWDEGHQFRDIYIKQKMKQQKQY